MTGGKNVPCMSYFVKNAEDYAERSTVHGISYIFDSKLGRLDRILWFAIVISSMSLALWMISSSYSSWQDNLVMTTLKTTTKKISELDFPAVTICAGGRHMGLVEKVLYNNFLKWNISQTQENRSNLVEEQVSAFMKDVFEIEDKGINIMDILDTMIAPEASASNAIRKHQVSCAKKKERRKRSTTNGVLSKT
jgi:hypothetical protein